MPKKHDAKGRSTKSGRFVMLPEFVLASPAYAKCPLPARALLVEVARLYMGTNNGRLVLSVRHAAELLDCAKDTANKAFQELERRGFIEASVGGFFSVKTRPAATEWRVTWKACDRSKQLPTNAFAHWKPTAENNSSVPKFRTPRPKNWDRKAVCSSDRSQNLGQNSGFIAPIGPENYDTSISNHIGAPAESVREGNLKARTEANGPLPQHLKNSADGLPDTIGGIVTRLDIRRRQQNG